MDCALARIPPPLHGTLAAVVCQTEPNIEYNTQDTNQITPKRVSLCLTLSYIIINLGMSEEFNFPSLRGSNFVFYRKFGIVYFL